MPPDTGIRHPRRPGEVWWLTLAPSANARSVAVLRIATGFASVYTGIGWVLDDATGLPRELWRAPVGLSWLMDFLPSSSGAYLFGCGIFLFLCAAVVLGYQSKLAAALAALLGIYLGVVPALTGKVDHYHHVIWFLALIALAPADDAWAVRKSPHETDDAAYAAITLTGVLLLGFIYLSSGIPKLAAGPEWVWSDNMRNIIWNQWWEKDHSFPLSIDNWPVVYKSAALGVVAFEVLFLPLALYHRSRRWIRWVGVGFHGAIWAVLGIGFWSLIVLYVVLFDWGETRRVTPATEHGRTVLERLPLLLALVVGLGVFVDATDGRPAVPWPVAAYPTSAHLEGTERLAVFLRGEAGEVLLNRSALAEEYGSHRVAALASTALARNHVPLLLDHVAALADISPESYDELSLEVVSVRPEATLSGS